MKTIQNKSSNQIKTSCKIDANNALNYSVHKTKQHSTEFEVMFDQKTFSKGKKNTHTH